MWLIFIIIFLGLFIIGTLAYLLFDKIFNYLMIEKVKTKNKIKELEEREEKD